MVLDLLMSAGYNIDRTNKFIDWFYSPEFIFGIAKYAICILTGIILAYFICTNEGEKMGIKKDDILVCMTIVVPLAILGARIWYMVGDGIHSFRTYMEDYGFFKAIIYIIGYTIGFDPEMGTYDGISGLAIHGGVVVAFLATIICSKWKKWNPFVIGDMVAPGLLIGQISGRWGNFFNQEAHGIVVGGWHLEGTELIPNIPDVAKQYEILTKKWLIPPFIAKFMYMDGEYNYYGVVDGVQKYGYLNGSYFFHPTFLYESLLNLLGLGIYFILRRRKFTRQGTFIGFYLVWYGIVRFIIEIVRTDSLYLGNTGLKLAQVTSIGMILLGVIELLFIYVFKKTGKYMDLHKKVKEEKEMEAASLKGEKEEEEIVTI